MRRVLSVEMANDYIYEIGFGKALAIKADGDGFSTFEGDQELNFFRRKDQAKESLLQMLVDDDMIIKGYGKHSGRKFCQIPQMLTKEVYRAAETA